MITVMTVALMMTWVVPELADDLKRVNINSTNLDELMALDGVGQKVAQNIVDYSRTYGPFEAPVDVMKVKGVGPKLFEFNQSRIMVQGVESESLYGPN